MVAGRRKTDAKRPGNGAGHGGPARGAGNGSPAAEAFAPGNAIARTHGAFSPAKLDPLVRDLVLAVLADPALSYLQEPRFSAELRAWARAESAVLLCKAWLDDHGGLIDHTTGEERSVVRTLDRAEARAASGRRELGLSPRAAAALGRDVAATNAAQAGTLDRLRADGRTIAVERGLIDGDA